MTTSTPPTTGGPGGNETPSHDLMINAFTASNTTGEVPLNITFTIDASGSDDATWRLAPGDGSNATEGAVSDLPSDVTFAYSVAGNFTAQLFVMDGEMELNATIALNLTAPAGAAPEQTEWEFGLTMGCASDANSLSGGAVPPNCVSFHAGPNQPAIDGNWIALDERYWNLAFTSSGTTVDGSTDTDCLLLDADLNIIGEGNNGGDECMGVIVPNTAWVFYYPWALPAEHTTFTVLV